MPSPADAAPTEPHATPADAPTAPLEVREDIAAGFELSLTVVVRPDADAYTRELVRTTLEGKRWPGNATRAASVAAILIDNAVRHGAVFPDGTVSLRLAVDADTRELAIEVEDASHEFPGFAGATQRNDGRTPNGLWWVAQYKGRLSWTVTKDDDAQTVGKRVQVILPAY
ncbi:ATP-binding protein [Streptomyces sp. NPDC047072]|uniref:ATP-binding protein n=1 Tax=Streptomyces sp. NPDC047072 TaxID=3154809 RepID=UPI0033DAF53C